LVLYAYLCVFAHSRFVENPPIRSWETNPSFLRWFCHTIRPHFIISHRAPFFIGTTLPTNRETLLSRTISYFKTIVWMYVPVEQSPNGTWWVILMCCKPIYCSPCDTYQLAISTRHTSPWKTLKQWKDLHVAFLSHFSLETINLCVSSYL
jgi:hypothetical protein